MKLRNFFSKKGVLETALVMLKIIVENANPNVMFISSVILGIFWIGFNCHFKCEQLKSEERVKIRKSELETEIKIRKMELEAEIKVRKMELEAETRQSERKNKKRK